MRLPATRGWSLLTKGAATDPSNSVTLGMAAGQCRPCFVSRSLEGNVKSIVSVYVIHRHKRRPYLSKQRACRFCAHCSD